MLVISADEVACAQVVEQVDGHRCQSRTTDTNREERHWTLTTEQAEDEQKHDGEEPNRVDVGGACHLTKHEAEWSADSNAERHQHPGQAEKPIHH